MSWFARTRGSMEPKIAFHELAVAVKAVGCTALLEQASGKKGLRRYLLRFERKPTRIRLMGMDTERLKNGGPPDPDSFDACVPKIEAMLGQLHQKIGPRFPFERGAIGVIRDATGPIRCAFRFDEDSDGYGLPDLRLPRGEGQPAEELSYLKALDAWAPRIEPVRAHWVRAASEPWSLEKERLRLGHPGQERSWKASALASYVPTTGDFSWLIPSPAGDELPFLHPTLVLELRAALELVAFAAARLQCSGVFQGTLLQPAGMQAFLGLKEG